MRSRDKPETAIVNSCIFQSKPQTNNSQRTARQVRSILVWNYYNHVISTQKTLWYITAHNVPLHKQTNYIQSDKVRIQLRIFCKSLSIVQDSSIII